MTNAYQFIGINEYFIFLEQVKPALDKQLVIDATDIEHGQWELPFEAILLALISSKICSIDFDFALVQRLANEADIIDMGVIDPDTWSRFLEWKSSLTNKQ